MKREKKQRMEQTAAKEERNPCPMKEQREKTKDIKTGPLSLTTPHNQAQGRGRKPGSLTSTFGLNVR